MCNMSQAKFSQQLLALLKIHWLYKIRTKKSSCQEILLPLIFVFFLAIAKYSTSLTKPDRISHPQIDTFPVYSLKDFSGSLGKSTIFVSPNTELVHSVINKTLSVLPDASEITVRYFNSAKDMLDTYISQGSHGVYPNIKGVDFAVLNLSSQESAYTLRMASNDRIPSEEIFWIPDPPTLVTDCPATIRDSHPVSCKAYEYLSVGFIQLQLALDTALTQTFSGNPSFAMPDVSVQLFPKARSSPEESLSPVFSLAFPFSFIVACSGFVEIFTLLLMNEKESGTVDLMRMMGMLRSAYWVSWFLFYAGFFAVATVAMIMIIWFTQLVSGSNLFLLFLLLFLYGISLLCMVFAVTQMFSKASLASNILSLGTLALSSISLVIIKTRSTSNDEGPISDVPVFCQYLLSLLSPVAFVLGADRVLYLDWHRHGLSFKNLNDGQFPVSSAIFMLFMDSVLYRCLGFYVEYVYHKNFKHGRPLCSCFMRSFWRKKSNETNVALVNAVDVDETENNGDECRSSDYINPRCEELLPEMENKRSVRICNVSKVYGLNKTEKAAIDGLTLDVCEGHITALLGHNGAGKTTLTHILTGLIAPTNGTVKIYGLDVTKSSEMDQVRSLLGVCPQQNVLFDHLTVTEHLRLYAQLKGVQSSQVNAMVHKLLTDLDFLSQADKDAKHLSGGQKRLLCLAIALLNCPKVIFLDEPTSGMDPVIRRKVWSYLQSLKAGRVILLTTQFLDEADLLADRKAILNHGKLICVGSSFFLKNHFGVGYHLSLDVESDTLPETEIKATQLVQKHVKTAVLKSAKGRELSYMLPVSASSQFPALFRDLEDLQSRQQYVHSSSDESELFLTSFGVSINSLEEVLLKIELMNQSESEAIGCRSTVSARSASQVNVECIEMQSLTQSGHVVDVAFNNDYCTRTSVSSMGHQIVTLMKVWLLSEKRVGGFWAYRWVVPIIIVICGLAFSSKGLSLSHVSSLSLVPNHYCYVDDDSLSWMNPRLLVLSKPGHDETKFVGALRSLKASVQNTPIDENLLAIAPHHIGFKLNNLSTPQLLSAVTILYNDSAFHSLPVAVNLLTRAQLKQSAPSSSIHTYSQPWPELLTVRRRAEYIQQAFMISFIIWIALTQASPSIANSIIKDRVTKCRQQLRVTGVSTSTYWISRLLFHSLQCVIPALISAILLLIFGVKFIMVPGAMACIIILFILCTPYLMLFTYNFSLVFNSSSTVALVLPNICVLITVVPFMLTIELSKYESTKVAASAVHYLCLLLIPPYGLLAGVSKILMIYVNKVFSTHDLYPVLTMSDYFLWNSEIPQIFLCIVLGTCGFFLLLRALESLCYDKTNSCIGRKTEKNTEDGAAEGEQHSCLLKEEDVELESQRVEQIDVSNNEVPPLVVRNLHKNFKNKKSSAAVSGTSFAVEKGEIFGLLGPNGAGKSTTMNIAIAEISATSGVVRIGGRQVSRGNTDLFRQVSYCPQDDPLWGLLTMDEHLECYAALRGVAASQRKSYINRLLTGLKLEEHRHKYAKKLSIGTRRKLTFLLSTLGDQRVAFLDEPTSGVDPHARRLMWNIISDSYGGTQRCCILSTHHMDEADVLCSRVAIMVNGQLQCIGSTQHLKSKYGSEYVLELELAAEDLESNTSVRRQTRVDDIIKELFGRSDSIRLVEQVADHFVYRIPQNCVALISDVFAHLESLKSSSFVSEYSFSQSTLEQVFLKMAKHQNPETGT